MEPLIYTITDKEKLHDLIFSFHELSGLTIQVLDENGHILDQCGQRSEYCKHFTSHISSRDTCLKIHANAGRRAMKLGEAYIFSCHSNLSHIVFPLVNNNTLYGSVMIGPFLMGNPDSTLILDLGKRYPDMTTEDLMNLYDDSALLPQVEPSKVTHIGRILYYLFSNLVTDYKEQFVINQNKLHQQAKISESIHMYKTGEPTKSDYPFELEQQLLDKVKQGNLNDARGILNDLLGYVLLSSGNNLETVKNRSLELCSLLSRTAASNGASANYILKINNNFLQTIQTCRNTEDLCYALSETLSIFIDCLFPNTTSSNSRIIRDAMNYISSHFSEPITLQDVADNMHLNAAYFSRIFKQISGSTFKEYLTMVRIEESKRLLRNTDYPLLDIAIAVGFDNQSYFTRVFKKYTGTTPKNYRS